MTKLDFPDTPSTGQQYGSSGTVWRWDGTRWGSTAGAAGARGRVAYAQIVAVQGGIAGPAGTEVVINGMVASWTADPSRTYRTTVYAVMSSSTAGDYCGFYIKNGATKLADCVLFLANAGVGAPGQAVVVESGLSGTQTRTVSGSRVIGVGTGSFYAAPGNPAFILVEDITYEAGSSNPYIDVSTLPKGIVGEYDFYDINTDNIGAWTQINYMQVYANVVAGRIYRVAAIGTFQVHAFLGTGNFALKRNDDATYLAIHRWGNGPATADIMRTQRVEYIHKPTVTRQELWNGYAAFDGGNCSHRPTLGAKAFIYVEDLGLAK